MSPASDADPTGGEREATRAAVLHAMGLLRTTNLSDAALAEVERIESEWATPPADDASEVLTSENPMEDRVVEALRKALLGDRAIPDQHEQWWQNLAQEAIGAMRAAIIVEREASK